MQIRKYLGEVSKGTIWASIGCLVCVVALLAYSAFETPPDGWEESKRQGEAVNHFATEIRILPDRSLVITENIALTTKGVQFKHGLVRTFETHYENLKGALQVANFDIKFSLRDKKPVKFDKQEVKPTVAFYLGDPEKPIEPGVYSFLTQYKITGRLEETSDRDILRWSVTGGWFVPVASSSALLIFPKGTDLNQINVSGWLGVRKPEDGKQLLSENLKSGITVSRDQEKGELYIKGERSLEPGEELYLEVSLPRGIVRSTDV